MPLPGQASAPAEAQVSVVIPTRGRPQQVVTAVRSALDQTFPPLEVIVVIDGPDPATRTALAQVGDPRIRLIEHGESRRAGAARNTGIRAARGNLVAFLDDDDTWLPSKLEVQLAEWRRVGDPEHTVVSCQCDFDDGQRHLIWPLRAPREKEAVAEYLFVRDRAGEGVLATPSLLVPTALARACPFPEDLSTHEEWDWLLDLEADGAAVTVVMEPLVHVDARPRRVSVSSADHWRTSVAWANCRRSDLGPRAYSGFLLTEAARGALDAGASPADQLRIVGLSLRGRPRARDLARCAARPLVTIARRRGHR